MDRNLGRVEEKKKRKGQRPKKKRYIIPKFSEEIRCIELDLLVSIWSMLMKPPSPFDIPIKSNLGLFPCSAIENPIPSEYCLPVAIFAYLRVCGVPIKLFVRVYLRSLMLSANCLAHQIHRNLKEKLKGQNYSREGWFHRKRGRWWCIHPQRDKRLHIWTKNGWRLRQ